LKILKFVRIAKITFPVPNIIHADHDDALLQSDHCHTTKIPFAHQMDLEDDITAVKSSISVGGMHYVQCEADIYLLRAIQHGIKADWSAFVGQLKYVQN
jgi:hypothetical protein